MASRKPPTTDAKKSVDETRLQEAQARLKAATERHAAIVAVMSRLRVNPGERRLAQSESKKAERELQEARRLLREAEAAASPAKARDAA